MRQATRVERVLRMMDGGAQEVMAARLIARPESSNDDPVLTDAWLDFETGADAAVIGVMRRHGRKHPPGTSRRPPAGS